MLSSEPSIASQILPSTIFSRLQSSLQHVAQTVKTEVLAVDETVLGLVSSPAVSAQPFLLIVSEPFSALLQGEAVSGMAGAAAQALSYRAMLTFEPEAIASFIHQLSAKLNPDSALYSSLMLAQRWLQPNDPQLQSEFTLRLASCVVESLPAPPLADPVVNALQSMPENGTASVPVHPAFCHPAEAALLQQIEQERLLNQMMTQIRQSLELPVILQTVVKQVRQFLQVDRLVIYQLHTESQLSTETFSERLESPDLSRVRRQGFIAYEAIASSAIPSVLNLSEDCCFFQRIDKHNLYRQGYTLAVNDVETHYTQIPCLLTFLRQAGVRAKLIAPILVHGKLWGLLIAHHCAGPRRWQDTEQKFLQRIAQHLAIAISQAQLYIEVQQQKQTLEQRVIERTQDLHDAMLAAQAANRAKSEFLAAVSHELRTPLTCVIGMSTTLMRWADHALNERQQRFLQTIHDSGEQLMELINDLLEMSQLEGGKAVLDLGEFSLIHMAQQSLRVVQDKATAGGVELELDVQVDEQRDRFTADAKRVQQILLNLLSNAIKFTPKGGKVILRVFLTSATAVFQVKDTGIGISEQQRSLLFQKFQQLDPSYHRQYEGIGLGLALTKQLVELHGGWIDVESTVGVGSVFTVHLPVPQAQPSTSLPASIAEPPSTATPGRIVLIENHEESANIICDILNAAGYQLVWMLEGATAIPQIEILQPVAVITNTWLPDSDGYDIIHQLRENPLTKKIKIVALTSTASFENRNYCIATGADDCLIKPIRPEQVLHKINALVAKNSLNTNTNSI